jgi:hypothetical protein
VQAAPSALADDDLLAASSAHGGFSSGSAPPGHLKAAPFVGYCSVVSP